MAQKYPDGSPENDAMAKSAGIERKKASHGPSDQRNRFPNFPSGGTNPKQSIPRMIISNPHDAKSNQKNISVSQKSNFAMADNEMPTANRKND